MKNISLIRRTELRFTNELLVVLGVNGVLFFLNFATLKLLTNIIPPSEFGVYSLAMTVLAFLSLVLVSPINQYTGRFGSSAGLPFIKALLLIIIKISAVLFILGSASVLLFSLDKSKTIAPSFLLALFLGYLFSAAITIIASVINAKRKRIAVGIVSIADAILRFGTLVLVVNIWEQSAYAIFCGIAIANLISSVFAYYVATRVVHSDPSSGNQTHLDLDYLVKYSLPFVLTGLLSSVVLYSDRWIVSLLLDSAAVAYYASATAIAFALLAVFFGIGNQYFLPVIFSTANQGVSGASCQAVLLLKRYIHFSCLAYLGAIIIGWLGNGLIYKVMFPPDYSVYKSLLPLSLIGYALYFLGELFCVYGQIHGLTKIYWWCKIPPILALFSITPALFYRFGIIGISYGLAFSSLSYLLSVLLANRWGLNAEKEAVE